MAGHRGPVLPPNSLALHEMFASVMARLEEVGECKEDLKQLDQHSDDFFHPENIFNKTRNFPTSANSRMARLKAVELLAAGKEQEAARLLLLAQANTFQHQFQLQYAKRLAKKTENAVKKIRKKEEEKSEAEDEEESFEEKQKRLMLFNSFEATDLSGQMSQLPPSWTVVQVGVAEDPLVTRFKTTKKDLPGDQNPDLILLRVARGQLTVGQCRGPESENCSAYLKELSDILAENTHVNRHVKVKTKYWQIRTDLDNRLTALVSSIEEKWLADQRWLLLGQLSDPSDQAVVEEVIKVNLNLQLTDQLMFNLSSLLSATPYLSPPHLATALAKLLPQLDQPTMSSLVLAAKERLSHLVSSPRHPVILICDPMVQSLPWESLPCLTKCKQAASRVPSFPFLYCLWQAHSGDSGSVVTAGLAAEKVFYVVNPDSSLPETQKRLDKAFQEWTSWEGLTGQEPSKGQLEQVLQAKDCFMYCGHGSGSKYLSGDEVEKLRVRAAPLLMGCSSGRLERLGRSVDPLGTAHSYLMAASPALLGFLWSVTDLDTDKWTVAFLSHWLGGEGEPRMLQAVADKRSNFKNFTNSCALVMYGLPLSAKVST